MRTHSCAATITGIIVDQPVLDLCWVEDPAAIKTAADRIPLKRFHVIVTELVGFDIIFHKTFTEVTAPESTESTNSTMPAYKTILSCSVSNVNAQAIDFCRERHKALWRKTEILRIILDIPVSPR